LTTAFHAAQTAALRSVFASVTGAENGDFDRDALTVTTRPEPAMWPFAAMVVGFGSGTVACFDAPYVEWAREHAPPEPEQRRAFYMVIQLTAEAAQRGDTLHPAPPMLGWALSGPPAAAEAPPGYRLERVSREWMNEWQRRDVFTNALGQSVQMHRTFRNQFACVLFDGSGEPAAIAGAYDTAGLSEIGVDVAAAHRGRGLAPVAVRAVSAAILEESRTPFYVCEVSNVRSQRTALASGFLPTCSLALAMPAGMGLAE
jgi:RimJ/RimL family protein N-acetyltransferase